MMSSPKSIISLLALYGGYCFLLPAMLSIPFAGLILWVTGNPDEIVDLITISIMYSIGMIIAVSIYLSRRAVYRLPLTSQHAYLGTVGLDVHHITVERAWLFDYLPEGLALVMQPVWPMMICRRLKSFRVNR